MLLNSKKPLIFINPNFNRYYQAKTPAQYVNLAVKQAFAVTLTMLSIFQELEPAYNLRTFDTISEDTAPVKLQIIYYYAKQLFCLNQLSAVKTR